MVYSDRGTVCARLSCSTIAAMRPARSSSLATSIGRHLQNGVRWFHSGGIFAALSETTGEVIIEGMKAAKPRALFAASILNFREKLWNIWGGDKAAEVVGRIVQLPTCWWATRRICKRD